MGILSIWHWLVLLLVVVLVFGTGKLRNLGSDLGESIKNFRQSVKSGEEEDKPSSQVTHQAGHPVEDELIQKDRSKV